jgi:hypothetical protein
MHDEDSTPQDDALRKIEMTIKLLTLTYTLWIIWTLIPEHHKRYQAMRLARTLERSAWRTACRAGHQAMGLELRGRATSYDLPYLLARLGDKAGRVYEKLRYTA